MTTLTIAARELRERSRLILFAAALAVIPFIAALMPGTQASRVDVIAAVSSFLALALPLAAAAGLGASTVARDLVERRLSFYFSKPVSPAAIWIGKAGASLLACYACFAIIALPSIAVSRGAWPMLWLMTGRQLMLIVGPGIVILFFLSHFLSTIIRSRSVLVAVDFVCAAAALGIVALLARKLLVGGANDLTKIVGIVIAAAILILIAIAPIWQLRNGRTDIRRSHAALSRFLWPAVLAVVAVAAIYVLWVVTVSPSQMESVLYLEQPPSGERAFIAGRGNNRGDYHASFLMNGGGEWKRIGSVAWSQMAFSRDGKTAAWFDWAGFLPGGETELHTDHGPTGIRAPGYTEMVLSDDGSRVAVGRGNLVTVFDLRSGRLLASAGGFDGRRSHSMFFVNDGILRVIERDHRIAHTLKIFELDVARKKLALTGTAAVPSGDALIASNDGSRLLLRKNRRVLDGRTGATLLDVPPSDMSTTAVLNDGRVVEIYRDGKTAKVRVTGGKEVVLPVGAAAVAGTLADGTLLVSGAKAAGWSPNGTDRTTFAVDLDRGVIAHAMPDVKGPSSRWYATDPRLIQYEARLSGVDSVGKLVWWDPRKGGR